MQNFSPCWGKCASAYLCTVDIIFKGRGGAVHWLKYSLSLYKGLNNHNLKKKLYTQIWNFTTLHPYLAQCACGFILRNNKRLRPSTVSLLLYTRYTQYCTVYTSVYSTAGRKNRSKGFPPLSPVLTSYWKVADTSPQGIYIIYCRPPLTRN